MQPTDKEEKASIIFSLNSSPILAQIVYILYSKLQKKFLFFKKDSKLIYSNYRPISLFIKIENIDLFKFYLSNHNQHVSINGYESGLAAKNCGILQGSVLGALLFLLHINDLNQRIKFCKVHHFADDTNLLCLSNSIKKLNKLVNADLKHLANWLNANKFSLNVKKN